MDSNLLKIYFDFDIGSFAFKIEKDHYNFTQLVELFKTKHFHYVPAQRIWVHQDLFLIKVLLEEIIFFTDIDFSEDDKELLDMLLFSEPKDFKKSKLPIDKNFFEKFPILEGKEGYEKYQLEAIKHGLYQNRFILDIDVGHGKTYIVIGILHHLIKHKKLDRILWLCRYEGLVNTKLEILRFLGGIISEDEIGIVTTKNREIADYFDKKVILTTYSTFRVTNLYYYNKSKIKVPKTKRVVKKKPEILKKKTKVKNPRKGHIPFDDWPGVKFLIADEGQKLKNNTSQIFNAVDNHKEYFEFREVMSGTLGYKVDDYYSICKILSETSITGSFSAWKSYMTNAFGDFKPEKVLEFKQRILNRFIFSVKDAIKAPPTVEIPIFLEMSPKMNSIYKEFVNKSITKIRDRNGEEISGQQITNAYGYLAQFTSSPMLIADQFNFKWNFNNDIKLEALLSLLEKCIDEENKKTIIWVYYPEIGNLLKGPLAKYNPLIITGDVKSTVEIDERFKEVQKWREDDSRKLCIFSYVLATSINIPEATRVIYWDTMSDSDPRNQSKGRTRRATSTEETRMYHLLYDRSIDIYIFYDILEAKDGVKSAMSSKKELTIEDLKKVLTSSANDYLNVGER